VDRPVLGWITDDSPNGEVEIVQLDEFNVKTRVQVLILVYNYVCLEFA
jgi:hypothetical protein